MTRAHDKAFCELISAEAPLAGAVFLGSVPAATIEKPTPDRYVLIRSNRGLVRADRLTGQARRRRKTYWVHSVGLSEAQADAVAERVLARVLNQRLTVDGWRCEQITHEASQPVQKDDTTKPALYAGVDQFDFYTEPNP